MLNHRTRDDLATLLEPIAEFVKNVCNKQKHYKSTLRPPHMLIPINSGDGRSYLARIIANEYYKTKACVFSSRDIFLEFTLKETIRCIHEIDAEIQSSAEYANDFHGVIALDIDALIPNLGDKSGNEFFELVRKIKEHAVVISFVPADCSKNRLDMITEKIGMDIKTFPTIFYSEVEYAKFFHKFLPSTIILERGEDGFDKYKERINAYISKNVSTKTIKSIKEASEVVFFASFQNDKSK